MNLSEGRADDDGYGEVDDVASHGKFFEVLEHAVPLLNAPWGSSLARQCRAV